MRERARKHVIFQRKLFFIKFYNILDLNNLIMLQFLYFLLYSLYSLMYCVWRHNSGTTRSFRSVDLTEYLRMLSLANRHCFCIFRSSLIDTRLAHILLIEFKHSIFTFAKCLLYMKESRIMLSGTPDWIWTIEVWTSKY